MASDFFYERVNDGFDRLNNRPFDFRLIAENKLNALAVGYADYLADRSDDELWELAGALTTRDVEEHELPRRAMQVTLQARAQLDERDGALDLAGLGQDALGLHAVPIPVHPRSFLPTPA